MKTMKVSTHHQFSSPKTTSFTNASTTGIATTTIYNEEKRARELQHIRVAKWLQKQQQKRRDELHCDEKKTTNSHKRWKVKKKQSYPSPRMTYTGSASSSTANSLVPFVLPSSQKKTSQKSVYEIAKIVTLNAKRSSSSKSTKKNVRTHFKKSCTTFAATNSKEEKVVAVLGTIFPRHDVTDELNTQLLSKNTRDTSRSLDFAAMSKFLLCEELVGNNDNDASTAVITHSFVYQMIDNVCLSTSSDAAIDLISGVFQTHSELQVHVIQGFISACFNKPAAAAVLWKLFRSLVKCSPYAMIPEEMLVSSLGKALEVLLRNIGNSINEKDMACQKIVDEKYIVSSVFEYWIMFPEAANAWVTRYFRRNSTSSGVSVDSTVLNLTLVHAILGSYRNLGIKKEVCQMLVRNVIIPSIASEHLVVSHAGLGICADPVIHRFFWACHDSVLMNDISKTIYQTYKSHWDFHIRKIAEDVFETFLDF